MIELIATAAVLSCNEAKLLAARVGSHHFTRKEFREVISTIRDHAPPRCRHKIVGYPTIYRNQRNVVRWGYWNHPGVRPGWTRPGIRFSPVGTPSIVIRNTFRF